MTVPEEHREWEEQRNREKQPKIQQLKDEYGEFARLTCPECGKIFESKNTAAVINNYRNHRSVHNGKN